MVDNELFNGMPVNISALDNTWSVNKGNSVVSYYNDEFEVYFTDKGTPVTTKGPNYTEILPKGFLETVNVEETAKSILHSISDVNTIEKVVNAISSITAKNKEYVMLKPAEYAVRHILIRYNLISVRTKYSHRSVVRIAYTYWVNKKLIKGLADYLPRLLKCKISSVSDLPVLEPKLYLMYGFYKRMLAYSMRNGIELSQFHLHVGKDGKTTGRPTNVKYGNMPSFYNNGQGIEGRPDYELDQCRQGQLMKENNLTSIDQIKHFDQHCSIPHTIKCLNGGQWDNEDIYTDILPKIEAAVNKKVTRQEAKIHVLKVNFKGSDFYNDLMRTAVEDVIGANKYYTTIFLHEAFQYMIVNAKLIQSGYKFINIYDGWEFYGDKVPTDKEMEALLKAACELYSLYINNDDIRVADWLNDLLPTWNELTFQERSVIDELTATFTSDNIPLKDAITWYKFNTEILQKGIDFGKEYIARQLEISLGVSKFSDSRYAKFFNRTEKGTYTLTDDNLKSIVDSEGNLLISMEEFKSNKKYVKQYLSKLNLHDRFRFIKSKASDIGKLIIDAYNRAPGFKGGYALAAKCIRDTFFYEGYLGDFDMLYKSDRDIINFYIKNINRAHKDKSKECPFMKKDEFESFIKSPQFVNLPSDSTAYGRFMSLSAS